MSGSTPMLSNGQQLSETRPEVTEPVDAVDKRSAAHEVFENAPELRELILSHLPIGDLAVASRVNSAWQYSVKTSPQLKRNMFLTPSGPVVTPYQGETLGTNEHSDEIIYAMPLLINPAIGAVRECWLDIIPRRRWTDAETTCRAHSLFKTQPAYDDLLGLVQSETYDGPADDNRIKDVRMHQLVTQPPILVVRFRLLDVHELRDYASWGVIYNLDGVRVKDIVQIMRSFWWRQGQAPHSRHPNTENLLKLDFYAPEFPERERAVLRGESNDAARSPL